MTAFSVREKRQQNAAKNGAESSIKSHPDEGNATTERTQKKRTHERDAPERMQKTRGLFRRHQQNAPDRETECIGGTRSQITVSTETAVKGAGAAMATVDSCRKCKGIMTSVVLCRFTDHY